MQRRVPRTIATGPATGRKPINPVLGLILGMLMFGCIVFGGAIWTAPPLINDWRIKDIARVDDRMTVADVKCQSLAFLFHSCDLTIRVTIGAQTATRSLNYVFTGPLDRRQAFQVLVDPNRHDIITTDFGLQRLWNRTLTLVLGMLPFLLMFGATLYGLLLLAFGHMPLKR